MTKIIEANIDDVMYDSYETYALEVIKDRALPDVRDGLKNVHRRIIYSSYELGLEHNKPYKKSARLVGEVLGKYHPHGDSSVYDASVRLAQDFSMRYMLLDGHGNFGSIDGDSQASMRYTEIRQREILKELIRDINKDTVKFVPNFDGEEREPSVLPGRLPNLLINGSSGVAVGFATEIPSHNLNETVDGIIYQIDNPNCNIADLLQFIKAPDFPTGGIIINPYDLEKIYSNGQGAIRVRAKHHIETIESRVAIILTEIPYKINKSKLIEEIYNLSLDQKVKDSKTGKDKIKKAKISEIHKVRDESDRDGMRIVIELKKNSIVNRVLSLLYKHSKVQDNFNVNMTAVKDKVLLENISLKEMINYYIEHQKEVIYNASVFDLKKSRERLHILEGLKKAIENIDLAIKLIRESTSKEEAREKLITNLNVDLIQANSILEIKLQRLVNMEIESIIDEYNNIVNCVKELEKLVSSEKEILNYLKEDLLRIKKTYGDDRKTSISYEKDTLQEISATELIEDFSVQIVLTKEGYVKKNRKYSENQKMKDGDEILNIQQCSNRGKVILLSSKANAHLINISDLEDKLPSQLGIFLSSIIDLQKDESIINMLVTNDYRGFNVVVFENGKIAKIPLESYATKTNRKMLSNSLSLESNVVSIYQITDDVEIELQDSFGKTKVVNTAEINAKSKRDTIGVQAHKSARNGFKIVSTNLKNI